GHPSPAAEWENMFARVDSPPPDEFNIFIGREDKVEEAAKALDLGKVVVVWGPGGVGKTSLVRAVINRIAPNKVPSVRFPDGILYYDFYGSEHTADACLRYVARFYGVQLTNDISPRDAASLALENRRALIVLDGAEEAGDIRKVLRIRREC